MFCAVFQWLLAASAPSPEACLSMRLYHQFTEFQDFEQIGTSRRGVPEPPDDAPPGTERLLGARNYLLRGPSRDDPPIMPKLEVQMLPPTALRSARPFAPFFADGRHSCRAFCAPRYVAAAGPPQHTLLAQTQRRFSRLQRLHRQLVWPPMHSFVSRGTCYELPLRARSPSCGHVPLQEVEYLAGFFDGDGSAGCTLRGQATLSVAQSVTHPEALLFLYSRFGGGIYNHRGGMGPVRPSLQWLRQVRRPLGLRLCCWKFRPSRCISWSSSRPCLTSLRSDALSGESL